jgi:transposase InsO family protein
MRQCLDAPLVVQALQMAIAQRRPPPSLIVHSDRGSQFASAEYRHTLAAHQLLPSMSRQGNCYDNAFIEAFWSSLKYELVYHRRFATYAEARTAIFDYIECFYNRTRLHSSLGTSVRFSSKPKSIRAHHPKPVSEKSGQARPLLPQTSLPSVGLSGGGG